MNWPRDSSIHNHLEAGNVLFKGGLDCALQTPGTVVRSDDHADVRRITGLLVEWHPQCVSS